MNKPVLKLSILLSLLSVLTGGGVQAADEDVAKIIERLESKGQEGVTLPRIEKGRIKGGFKYYILPDHALPIVKMVIFIRGGTIYDPPGRSGLTSILTGLIRSGGTEKLTPEQLDERLDTLASTISAQAKGEHISVILHSTTEQFKETLTILLDILFRPRFDEGRFKLLKKQYKDSIRRRADSQTALADVGFDDLIYGRDNPWGAYPTLESVDRIGIEDIRALYRQIFHPAGMIVGVAGDIEADMILKPLRSYQGYPESGYKAPEVPPGQPRPDAGVHLIEKEDANQVVFNVGHQGSYRFNPDQFNLIVMNNILGADGHTNRILPAVIREDMGLAYSIWSKFGFGPKESPGLFKIFLATKTESVKEAMDVVIAELKKFVEGETITEERLTRSKESILRKMVFEYASAFDIVSNTATFNYYGYPDDYVEIYGRKIAGVELGDVKRAAREYIHPDELQLVLVGDVEEIKKMLKGYLKYDTITIQE